jgi:subtilase family serine protease
MAAAPEKRSRVAIGRGVHSLLCITLLFIAVETRALAQGMATRHVRQEVMDGKALFLNPLPASQTLRLDIVLALRNQSELDNLLQDLYDPQSPSFHHFLSVAEFTERFGPSPEDYAAVIRFLQRNGMTVTGTSPNRVVLNVQGTVASIDSAFQVRMGAYRHPTEQRTFYSADRQPSVARLDALIWHISGLDNFSIPHPAGLRRGSELSGNATGSGPGGNFFGSDMRAAYYGGTSLTGAGQSVGLLEFGGYNVADVQAYFANAGQPLNVPVNAISTDGSSVSCTGKCDDTEQVLDIEEAISMAPGMSQVRVYVSKTSDVSIFNKMATDNISKSLSCSWGWSPADPASDDPIFLEFALQGQTLFVASGDNGAYTKTQQYIYPADDALVVSVGGTSLTTRGPAGSWESETAWSDSGGGIAPNIAIPKYQKKAGVITTANQGSTTLRNCPDVSAEANTDNYICYNGTCAGGWGGTSFAAPRWAAFLALLNQQAVAKGNSTLGFINSGIYTLGLGQNYSNYFHDISSGSNGGYSAGTGYDLVTGWGSPNGAGLFNTAVPSLEDSQIGGTTSVLVDGLAFEGVSPR